MKGKFDNYKDGGVCGVLRLPSPEQIDEVWNADNSTEQEQIISKISKQSVVDEELLEEDVLDMSIFTIPKNEVARVVFISQEDFCSVLLRHRKSMAAFGKPGNHFFKTHVTFFCT